MKKHVRFSLLCLALTAVFIISPYYTMAEDVADDGMFFVCINSGITVDADGFAAVNIENEIRNRYFMKVEIMVELPENQDETDTTMVLLEETPFLAPGNAIENLRVQRTISRGEYRGEAIFYAFDENCTGSPVGNVTVDVTVSILQNITGTSFEAVGDALSNVSLNAECLQELGKINIGLLNGNENLYSFDGEIVNIQNDMVLAEIPLLNPGETLDYISITEDLNENTKCLLQLHFYSADKTSYIGTGGKQMIIFKR